MLNIMMRAPFSLFLLLLFWLATLATVQAQDAPADPLADPVVRGAWLYEGNCVRCHGAYAAARLGEDKTSKALKAEISGEDRQGCAIDWSISRGGVLAVKEIGALVNFVEAWEEERGDLSLPPLPPQPTPTPAPSPTAATDAEALPATLSTPTPTPLPPDLMLALDGNPVARGAWLYVQNCYRCHQDYSTGRMGLGLERDRIERTIQAGKIGSNMPGFAINQGGTLGASEIKLIVAYIDAWESLGAAPVLPPAVQEIMPQPLDPARLAPVQGDAEQGALHFGAYCAACHGSAGQGGAGPALARFWPGAQPDLMLLAVISQGVPGSAMRGWAHEYGGPLDSQAAHDLVAFLLSHSLQENAASPPPVTDRPVAGYEWLLVLLATVLTTAGLAGAFIMRKRLSR